MSVYQGFINESIIIRTLQYNMQAKVSKPKANLLLKIDLDSKTNIRYCVVDMATSYGLEGPGIESQWRQDFLKTSTLTLEPTASYKVGPGPPSPGVNWLKRGI